MELSYALLAKKADFGSDGLLSVIGADISVLGADEFPYVMDSLALVARIGFPASETAREHVFEAVVYDPDGSNLTEESPFSFTPGPAQPPDKASYFGVIANFDGTVFPKAGAYQFAIKVDAKELKRLVLQMVPKTITPMPANAPSLAATG